MLRTIVIVLAALSALASAQVAKSPLVGAPQRASGNVLMLVLDDVGVDQIASYRAGYDLPAMPNVDALAREGVRFSNAWANPVCSTTRATILTGRYSFRNGIGHTVKPGNFGLPLSETTLPEVLDAGTGYGYAHAAFGKWHLGDGKTGGWFAPNLAGFGHYAGVLENPISYEVYEKVEDGSGGWKLGYLTSETVNDALAWLATAPEPWFCYVAFHAGHQPFHAPPPGLYDQDLSAAGDPITTPRPYYKAMLEGVDREIGRLLTGLGPARTSTTVLLVGDNGTPAAVIAPPLDPLKSKATLYEGGVHVPLIVAGPPVTRPGARCDALVAAVDLFATVADLAGADLARAIPSGYRIDSRSLVPYLRKPNRPSERAFIYAEIFQPHALVGPYSIEGRAIRDERYKYIQSSLADPVYGSGYYDLENDPFEQSNLLKLGMSPAEHKRLDGLRRAMQQLLGS